jgi:hypothetical protein
MYSNKELFIATKHSMSTPDFCEEYGIDPESIIAPNVLVYDSGYYIEDFGVEDYEHGNGLLGRYYMIIERDDWVTNDIQTLESFLYSFYVDQVDGP